MIFLEKKEKRKDFYFQGKFNHEYDSPEFVFLDIKKKKVQHLEMIEVNLNDKKNRTSKKIFGF